MDMSDDVIDSIFSKLSGQSIRTILFTGGEPALGHRQIAKVAEAITKYEVYVDAWFVITNGKAKGELQRSFVKALNDVHNVCKDNDQASGLEISNDYYHDYIADDRRQNLIEMINEFQWADYRLDGSYFPTARLRDKKNYYKLVPDGRAKKMTSNMLMKRWEQCYSMIQEETEEYVDLGHVYVNAKGDVIPDCNFSFVSQESVKLCSVLDPKFGWDMLVAAARKWDKKLCKLKDKECANV